MFSIRKTTLNDLDECERIFNVARKTMIDCGNPTQWAGEYPNKDDVIIDINNGNSYVVLYDDKIVGTLAYIRGIEPTYLYIEDGKWLNDDEYATIHRIASDNSVKGMFEYVIDYFTTRDNIDIRIDTHRDNKIMIHLVEKYGFKYCGIIYVHDHSERLAFELCKKY